MKTERTCDFHSSEEGIQAGLKSKMRTAGLLIESAREIFDHHPDGFLFGLSKNCLAAPFTADKTGISQLFDVMGNRGKGDGKIAGHSTDGRMIPLFRGLAAAMTDPLKDGQTRFIGQGFECRNDLAHVFQFFISFYFFFVFAFKADRLLLIQIFLYVSKY